MNAWYKPIQHSSMAQIDNKQSPIDSSNILYTTRKEVDGELTILEGSFPKDIFGEFYVIYPVGSVNSNGLPYPKNLPDGSKNPEYGTPIMNGDGYVVRISLSDKPIIKTRILKTPSYYADYHSRLGTPFHKKFGFTNMGLSRMSTLLGSKNPLNTSLTPFKTPDSNPLLIAGYDVGRPFTLDPVELKVKSPIASNNEWILSSPGFLPWPFPFIQTTAHPCFDPLTNELFIVNYSTHNYKLMNNLNRKQVSSEEHTANKNKFLELMIEIEGQETEVIRKNVLHFFHKHFGDENISKEVLENPDGGNVLQLLKFCGQENGPLEKWILEDQEGKAIAIKECMHQTALTRDYIILSDTSFKFAIDLLIQNFFPYSPEIARQIRQNLSKPMLPYTECYIVRRRDLVAGAGKATAYRFESPIPVETIHYSCEYDNPDGKITLYGMQNAAMCIAEWIRDIDVDKITGKPVDKDFVGLFALGNMDVSRLGKWIIDGETATIDENASKEFVETGNLDEEMHGPNSWSIGLSTFPNKLSAEKVQHKIDTIWFTSNGLSNKTLTEFIFELYKDYPNRKISVEEVLKATEMQVPSCLNKLDTATMAAKDYYQCPPEVYFRSIQYIPANENVSAGKEYILTTVQNSYKGKDGIVQYRGEFWIFDANNLVAGPICKMHHPDVNFCFTLHSCWLPEAKPYNLPYQLNIDKDLQTLINQLPHGQQIEDYFKENVYPYFR